MVGNWDIRCCHEQNARPMKKFKVEDNEMLGALGVYHIVEYKSLLLRVVPPYFYVIRQNYKQNWRNHTVGQLFSNGLLKQHQFGAQRAVDCGLIKVNDAQCTLDHVMTPHDILCQTTHRHEPPVLYVSAVDMIIYDDGDLVVVNKPSTVPVHPSGAYFQNSIVNIAKEELGMDIKPIHRLDRLVSGLVVFSRKSSTAKRIGKCLSANAEGSYVIKSYLARVHGKFTVGEGEETWRTVSIGILTVDDKLSLYECNDELGKESRSRFALLNYCPITNTSLVQCEPLTGRTHQLRLHLQAIGHPIANDPIYGPQGKLPITPNMEEENEYTEFARGFDRATPEEYGEELGRDMLDSCEGCKRTRRPPAPLGIWLHSMRFKVFERGDLLHEFICKPPTWWEGDVNLFD